jgi:hypothetical protein
MALIRDINHTSKERHSLHKPTRCEASTFDAPGNQRILQLDTFGTSDRDFPDKISQSIQLDEASAAKLKQLIEQAFPHLK